MLFPWEADMALTTLPCATALACDVDATPDDRA
jgi:hypothetical protein